MVFVSVVTIQAASTPTKSGNSVNSKETLGNEEFIKRIDAMLRRGDVDNEYKARLGLLSDDIARWRCESRFKASEEVQVTIEVLVRDEGSLAHLDNQPNEKS